ncbi:MAG: hypothetical protein ACR2NT_09635 [Acidimicrobiia bacterium]
MRRPVANKNGGGGGIDVGLLTPRARWFYERYGAGPYTPAQFSSMPGLIVEPSKELEPDPPPEVLAAMEREDLAAIAFDSATRVWESTIADVQRLGGEFRGVQSTGGEQVLIDSSGREISGRDQRKIARAQDAEQAAKAEREEAGVRLSKARVKSQEAQRQWRSTLYAAQLESPSSRG